MTSVVPTHGNYHNYHGYDLLFTQIPASDLIQSYRFLRYRYHHPGGHDTRLALLPHDLLADARVLDVGCNEGWVSCEIGAFFTSFSVACVDIEVLCGC
jgi:7SK snRNA methylphosphate capping enzyme